MQNHKLRILIVDDLVDTAQSMAFLLEDMGQEVNFITDPSKALAAVYVFFGRSSAGRRTDLPKATRSRAATKGRGGISWPSSHRETCSFETPRYSASSCLLPRTTRAWRSV